MNTAFYLQGTFFLVGAVLVARAVESQKAGLVLSLAATNATAFWLGPWRPAQGPRRIHRKGRWHRLGAFHGRSDGHRGRQHGNPGGIYHCRNAGAPQWYRGASLGIVVLGLLSSAMLVIDSRTAATNVMPDGAWE